MIKFNYKTNKYSYDGKDFRVYAGKNGWYISKVTDEAMIMILTEVVKGI